MQFISLHAYKNWSCLSVFLSWTYYLYNYLYSKFYTYIYSYLYIQLFHYILQIIFQLCQWYISALLIKELWARTAYHWENVLPLILVGLRFLQHCYKTKAILLNSPILSNKFPHSQKMKNNKHSDSIPLSLDYISVCREEGCSQLLVCSCLKMKHRHGNLPFTHYWHYLSNGLSPAVLS
mgnify:CR=1 FL=1